MKRNLILGTAVAAAFLTLDACNAADVARSFGLSARAQVFADAVDAAALQARLVALNAQTQGILARCSDADRDPDEAESAELDSLADRFDATSAQLARIQQQEGSNVARQAVRNAGATPQGNGRRSLPDLVADASNLPPTQGGAAPLPVTQWRDKAGAPVLCLAPGESVRATVRSPIRNGRQIGNGLEPPPSIGETVRAMITGDWSRIGDMRNAVVEGSGDATGGVFVMPQVSGQLIDLARAAASVFRAGARTVPMSTEELDLVQVVGEVVPGWVAETAAIPKSDPTFGRIQLAARKLAVITTISRELAEDAPNAAAQIQDVIASAFAQELDRVALLGSGTGPEPRGVWNTTGVQTLAVGGAVSYDTLLTAYSMVETYNTTPTAAILSPHAALVLRSIKESTGGYVLPPPSLGDVKQLVTSKMAADKGIVGDFRQLIIGMRTAGVQFEVSQVADTAFVNDLVLIKARMRVAVGVVRPLDFVKLTTIA